MAFYSTINPVLASIGPLEIRYYSLAYIIGAIFAYFMLKRIFRERKLGIKKEEILDFVAYTLLAIVVFSRIFYILFYNLGYFIDNPLQMLAVWQGGLSFHGGLVGAIVMGIWFAGKHKISFWELADIMVIPVAFCLFLGRIGNFINGELYGRITSVSWAVKFPSVDGFRHPSQLYEALKNLFMFSALYSIRNMKLKKGVMFSLFLVMYGFLRFFIEFLREPDAQIGLFFGVLSMGQLLCIAMLLIGIPMLVYFSKRKP
ncbi:MAG: prolipoprotein diacylglyceryl transferase [Candidatus Nanoarchaeia archaeon]|nr:prolipoprotein diacylglyceryl transferase [Candidatus Nanoarchaeia archaeon]